MSGLVTVADLAHFKSDFKAQISKELNLDLQAKYVKLSRIVLRVVLLLERNSNYNQVNSVPSLSNISSNNNSYNNHDHINSKLASFQQQNGSDFEYIKDDLLQVFASADLDSCAPAAHQNQNAQLTAGYKNDCPTTATTNTHPSIDKTTEKSLNQLNEQFFVNISDINSNLQNLENFFNESSGVTLQQQQQDISNKKRLRGVPEDFSTDLKHNAGSNQAGNNNNNSRYISISQILNDNSYEDEEEEEEEEEEGEVGKRGQETNDATTLSTTKFLSEILNSDDGHASNHTNSNNNENHNNDDPENNDYSSLNKNSHNRRASINSLVNNTQSNSISKFSSMTVSPGQHIAASGTFNEQFSMLTPSAFTSNENRTFNNSNCNTTATNSKISLPSLQESIDDEIFEILKKRRIDNSGSTATNNSYNSFDSNINNLNVIASGSKSGAGFRRSNSNSSSNSSQGSQGSSASINNARDSSTTMSSQEETAAETTTTLTPASSTRTLSPSMAAATKGMLDLSGRTHNHNDNNRNSGSSERSPSSVFDGRWRDSNNDTGDLSHSNEFNNGVFNSINRNESSTNVAYATATPADKHDTISVKSKEYRSGSTTSVSSSTSSISSASSLQSQSKSQSQSQSQSKIKAVATSSSLNVASRDSSSTANSATSSPCSSACSPSSSSTKANTTTKKPTKSTPIYRFAKIDTVAELLKEYFEGINGGPAIRDLELQYGARWRGGSKHSVSKQFNRRKNLYLITERAIADGKGQRSYDLAKCIEILENSRTFYSMQENKVSKKSLNWLTNNLPSELMKFLDTEEEKC